MARYCYMSDANYRSSRPSKSSKMSNSSFSVLAFFRIEPALANEKMLTRIDPCDIVAR